MSSIRLSLALSCFALLFGAGCGSTAKPKCLPSNCAGCCDAKGDCVAIPTALACGRGANVCVACVGDQVCLGGFCSGSSLGGGTGGTGGGAVTGGGGGTTGGGGGMMGGGGGTTGGGGGTTGGGGGTTGGGGGTTGGGGGTTGGGGGTTGGGGGAMGGGGGATGGGGGATGGGGGATGGGGGAAGGGGGASGGGGGASGGGGGATGGGGGATGGAFFAVLRVGPAADGGSLSNASTEVHLERRDLSTGAVAADIPLPIVSGGSNVAFTLAGTSATEGALSLSTNNQFAVAAGYNSVPGIGGVNALSTVPRVVARVDLGTSAVHTGTIIGDAFVAASIRSAASIDGTGYWLGGTSGSGNFDAGVRYVVHGSSGTSADVYSGIQNMRAAAIFNGQLYASTASGPVPDGGIEISRVFSVGTGTPMTATSAISYLPGVNVANPGNFVFLDQSTTVAGLDTLYVAETGGSGVGARKYTFDGTVWTQAATFPVTSGTGFYVAARANSASSVTVLVTCSAGVLKWDDTGSTPAAGTVLTAQPTGSAFRGVIFVP